MKRNPGKWMALGLTGGLVLSVLAGCGAQGQNADGTANREVQAQEQQGEKQDAGQEAVPSYFNETGYPIVNEPIELNVMVAVGPMNGDFNEMPVFVQLEEKTGIKINFEQVSPTAWAERKNLALASQDMPDIIIGGIGGMSDSEVNKYSSQGIIMELNDYIEKYAPNFNKLLEEKPDLDAVIRNPEGKIYGLPFYQELVSERIPDNLFINKKWLDKLGLAVPETTEEFYEVLKAFKTQDPNGNGLADEIPLSYRSNQRLTGELSLFGSFGVVDNENHLMIEDGKVLFSPMEEGYKEGIRYMNRLYGEGLIDPEVFTQDQSQYIGKGQSEEEIVGSFIIFNYENYVGAERAYSDYVPLLPLKGPDGDQLWNKYATGYDTNAFLITKNNKYPEASIRWADEFFTVETSMQAIQGEIGVNLEYENGKYKIMDPPEGSSLNEIRSKICPASYIFGMMTKEMIDNIEFKEDMTRKLERCSLYDPYTPEEILPVLRLPQDKLEQRANIFTDLTNYVAEMKAKWVTGEMDVEKSWEEYVETLKAMGVEDYVRIYQEAYDAYKAQ